MSDNFDIHSMHSSRQTYNNPDASRRYDMASNKNNGRANNEIQISLQKDMGDFGIDPGSNRSAVCENSFVDHAPPGSATLRGSRIDESLNVELQSEV